MGSTILPFVRVNMAITADGKIATASRSIHTFGSPRDSRNLYDLRSRSDAILCGARTVEETGATLDNGDPRFTRARIRSGRSPHPIRVVVSGAGSFSTRARLWENRDSPIHLWLSQAAPAGRIQQLERLADHLWISPGARIDLRLGLGLLAQNHGVRDVMVEGGGGLNDALFQADLVDELYLTWCPLLFGGAAAPTISDGLGVASLADAARFTLSSSRRFGDEIFLIYHRIGPEPIPE
jgi:riboflavin-specific deaminase-like protein